MKPPFISDSGSSQRTSNQKDTKSFYNRQQNRSGTRSNESLSGKTDQARAAEQGAVIYKGMKIKTAKVKIFILQNEKDFAKLKEL